jgi:hypothetical protein
LLGDCLALAHHQTGLQASNNLGRSLKRNRPDDPWKLNEKIPHDWSIDPDLGALTPDNWRKPK